MLARRYPLAQVVIYPTRVQGSGVEQEIATAIATADQRQECDVLILARGGGSLEDLWCFNSEALARAIFASEIPVVSAVGHEIDTTIADLVADVRAPTPSAGAELLTPQAAEMVEEFKAVERYLSATTARIIQHLDLRRENLLLRLTNPDELMQRLAQRVDDLSSRVVDVRVSDATPPESSSRQSSAKVLTFSFFSSSCS